MPASVTNATPGWALPTSEAELLRRQKDLLEQQLESLKRTIEEISQRLDELERGPVEP